MGSVKRLNFLIYHILSVTQSKVAIACKVDVRQKSVAELEGYKVLYLALNDVLGPGLAS